MRLFDENQFDTIYHEHFFLLLADCNGSNFRETRSYDFRRRRIVDARRLAPHLRSPRGGFDAPYDHRLAELRAREEAAGYRKSKRTHGSNERVRETKRKLLALLIDAKRRGKRVAGYGAPGKGNTLLNYCGIRTDFVDFTVDRNPYKHGKFLPGTHIPIFRRPISTNESPTTFSSFRGTSKTKS